MTYQLVDKATDERPGEQVVAESDAPILYENGCWVVGASLFADPGKEQYRVDAILPLSPMTFYLAFTPEERIAIKGSNDPLVQEFWATYQLAVQTSAFVDPTLVSVQQGVGYLQSIGILSSSERVAQVLAGVPQ